MESILPNPNTKNSAKVSEIIYLKHSCSFRWLTPKAFTNSSPGQRPGKLRSEVNGTLKEFAKSSCFFRALATTLSGLVQVDVHLTQGSALLRATLGWKW